MASDAIADHGFVLLLGEPACGKSTIAAMRCMTALDNWQCDVMRVDGPEDMLAHWNPDDPRQMFWIDDAFGSIRHDPYLTDRWARRMSEVMTAVGHGARVLMTSRDYIYRDARPRLKVYAYPRLQEQQVVIDVTKLSAAEKQQMLYNHLKAGDQPADVLEEWRPHLSAVAATDRFQPEVARRLSQQAFLPATGLHTERELARADGRLHPGRHRHRAGRADLYLDRHGQRPGRARRHGRRHDQHRPAGRCRRRHRSAGHRFRGSVAEQARLGCQPGAAPLRPIVGETRTLGLLPRQIPGGRT
ncbi:hypothetical protein [Kribbella ginsengisoli]|uniref:nSTAND3 domain-containing NTPase n=1 Tax=Kribbella ginsengisoli TaxID=363865 RepID=UPI0031E42832